jgi:hypothetical protein
MELNKRDLDPKQRVPDHNWVVGKTAWVDDCVDLGTRFVLCGLVDKLVAQEKIEKVASE